MKNSFLCLVMLFMLPGIILSQNYDEKLKYIEWTGENEIANTFATQGIFHLMNIEREKAFTMFEAAVKEDKTLFAPHVALAMMSSGDKKEYHKAEARRLVYDKNEPSKLYASLLDVEDVEDANEKQKAIWKKMRELAPDGPFVHFNYALTLDDTKMQIAELEKLAEISKSKDRSFAHVHNILGYLYYGEGDKETSKTHFERYMRLYPDGYNPYDSMGEYFLNEGDLAKALEYYNKAKEKFPAAINAGNKIDEIESKMEEGGGLILVSTESVSPGHMQDYIAWGKEYKAVADETNFRTFWVAASDGAFSYAVPVGKKLSDITAYEQEWENWSESNDELKSQYEKYKHSISSIKRSLWRHSPELSYKPANYEASDEPNTYTRVHKAHIGFGDKDKVKEILAEFRMEWEKANISQPWSVYWNVFGEEGMCVSIRSNYKDRAAWLAERDEVEAKIGKEKLNELMGKWSNTVMKFEESESYPQPGMTHIKNTGS